MPGIYQSGPRDSGHFWVPLSLPSNNLEGPQSAKKAVKELKI